MKFVLIVEEDGYELRYWDEINEEIRDSVITAWDTNEFYRKLVDMDFNISKKTLAKAVQLIESGRQDFVILASRKKPGHLDTLHEDYFEIEE
jgi:hypothetical protein